MIYNFTARIYYLFDSEYVIDCTSIVSVSVTVTVTVTVVAVVAVSHVSKLSLFYNDVVVAVVVGQ